MMLATGDIVTHQVHGTGTVLEEWGCWRSCRHCLEEIDPKATVCSYCKKEVNPKKPWIVSGRGVFEVEFANGETRSINQDWLEGATKIEKFRPLREVLAEIKAEDRPPAKRPIKRRVVHEQAV